MMKSEQINELAKALALAQAQIKPAHKDATNPFFKSKYADHSAIWEAAKEPLTRNGLSIIQSTRVTDHGGLILVTTLLHASGQWVSGEFPVKPMKEDAQALGSALTYAKRYALAAMVSIATEDDDGESAMNRSHATPKSVNAVPQKQTTYQRGQS